MVTNSPDVYEARRAAHPNLLHAQWACTGFWDGRQTPKPIDFSFVGQVYGTRAEQIRALRRKAGLVAFGRGAGVVYAGPSEQVPMKTRLRRRVQGFVLRTFVPSAFNEWSTIPFEQVNELWNQSRVSFTPLESSTGGVLQIKSRVMDMGLSGTLMLAPEGAGVERYYEPGKEFVEYDDLSDCADKARHYLRNEAERKKIADGYASRTLAEHLWRHRIEHVLRGAGLEKARQRPARRGRGDEGFLGTPSRIGRSRERQRPARPLPHGRGS